MPPQTVELTDRERLELCNLIHGAIARHSRAGGVLLTAWTETLKKLEGADKRVMVESVRRS